MHGKANQAAKGASLHQLVSAKEEGERENNILFTSWEVTNELQEKE